MALFKNRYNIDAYLDAPDNVISGSDPSFGMPSSHVELQSKTGMSQNQIKPKNQDLSRSQGIKVFCNIRYGMSNCFQ